MQRVIGAGVGAIITWFVLVITTADNSTEYVTAVVIGAIATILWPLVIGLFLARRVKQRRDEDIQREVDKQMSQKGG